MTLGQEFKQ